MWVCSLPRHQPPRLRHWYAQFLTSATTPLAFRVTRQAAFNPLATQPKYRPSLSHARPGPQHAASTVATGKLKQSASLQRSIGSGPHRTLRVNAQAITVGSRFHPSLFARVSCVSFSRRCFVRLLGCSRRLELCGVLVRFQLFAFLEIFSVCFVHLSFGCNYGLRPDF